MKGAIVYSIRNALVWLPSMISIGLGVGAFYVLSDECFQIVGKILLPICIVLFCLCVVFFGALVVGKLPRISRIIPSTMNRDMDFIILTEPYPELSQDAYCGLYYIDQHDYEVCVAIGYVDIVQTNKRIQIVMKFTDGTTEDLKKNIANNEDATKRRLILKPHASRITVEKLYGF